MIGRTVGHYRILERLGGGGMGVVYRAEDLTLDRSVALKFLPPELTRDEDAKKRFLIEAKAAARLDHPNICPVHEVAESDDGQTFIAMAYYEGESLGKRIERGPIPVDEAARIAIEVARGLGAAHQAGIIHRDIKPANVMLTAKGGVKIVDFGVAKLAGVTMTHGGGSPGTLAYMAPEQIRGEPVTSATDLWALGAVFYEMLTGSRPFKGDYEQAVAYTILNEPPMPLDQTLPQRPPVLDSVIARALTKDSRQRYQTAEELIEGLETVSGLRAEVAPAGAKLERVMQPRWAFALLLVLAVSASVWFWRSKAIPGAAKEAPSAATTSPETRAAASTALKRVAVAVFENHTGDASLGAIGQMIADWTSDGLARSGAVEVVGEAAAREVARAAGESTSETAADPLRRLAEISEAEFVISGSYYLSGETIQVQTKVTDVATRTPALTVEAASGPRANPMEVVQAVRQRVVDAIAGRYLVEGADVTAEEGRPPRYEAYKEYLAGLEIHGPAWDSATAVTHYRRALELDPEFVKPRFMIITAYLDRSEWPEMEREIRAITDKRDRLTPINVQRLRRFQAILDGREEDAVQAMREVVKLSPSDVNNNFDLANEANIANRPAEALRVATKPLNWARFTDRGAPMGVFYFPLIAGSHHMLGQHEAELAAIRRGREIYGDDIHIISTEARALAALGRTSEVEALIDHAATLRLDSVVLSRAALELRAHGNREGSIALWNRQSKKLEKLEGEAAERQRWYLAYCYYQAERFKEAEVLFERVAAKDPGNSDWKALLGDLAARRGDKTAAKRIAVELEGLRTPYLRGDNTFYAARIAAQLGERDEAVELLAKAISQGLDNYPGGFVGFTSYYFAVHEDMAFEPLKGYPPFEALMRPKG